MATPRSEVVQEGAEGLYHCFTRCVRRAFLCGYDQYSGRSYEHRREWIRSKLKALAASFAVEVLAYAVMSNHLHVVLRTRPDWVDEWSDEEVARRWLTIFPRVKDVNGAPVIDDDEGIRQIIRDADRLGEIRRRLQSVSWFMRCLNEFVAREANKEDNCKGRFWEGRFKCQALLDEAALVACMAYVDLNPIRAGLATTPEESDFTSIQERIEGRQEQREFEARAVDEVPVPEQSREETELAKKKMGAGSWLYPLGGDYSGRHDDIISLSLDEYLDLVDWTGRQIVEGKKGAIPVHLSPILTRLGISSERWLDTVEDFGGLFHRVVGKMESILAAARMAGKNWLKGIKAGREAFSAG